MTYPISSSVSAGDATLASHYNNLRLDAVYLGQAAANAAPLGSIFERYETRLELDKLAATTVRVPASASAPVSLVIQGYLCQAIANVDLDAGLAPSGAAAAYYVFANRADASTTFTLTVSTSVTEAANQRRIGRFYWDGTKIIKDSVRSEFAGYVADILYFLDPQICNGRLTISTGVPVPASDVASSASLYFTPYTGNRIALYVNNYGWRLYAFGELTLDVSGVAINKNLDIWVYDNEGTLTLSYTEWSNDTLRATALTRQDGVLVKSGSPSYRYLGTVRTSAAGEVCDTKLKRFIWNFYNRVERSLLVTEDTANWTYATNNTWRSLNADDTNRVAFVLGVNETLVNFDAHVYAENSVNNSIGIGICLDNTNANNANLSRGTRAVAVNYNRSWYGAHYHDRPGEGYHFLQIVELSGGDTTTYYGDKSSTNGECLSGGIGFMTI